MATIEIKRGDIFFINFDPAQGFEIKGNRPALVIQNDLGNRYGGTIIVAAMTTNMKKSQPVHVRVLAQETGLNSDGVVLLDQIRSITREHFVRPPAGRLIKEKMLEIDEALKISLGLKKSDKQ
jgi:mRNA interferase MazF